MIEPTILLQVDAAIIAGVLILLTVGHFRNEPQRRNRSPLPYRYAAVVILPFALSAICVLASSLLPETTINATENTLFPIASISTWFAIFGFLYLIAFISILAFKMGSEPGIDLEIRNHYWYEPEKEFTNSIVYTIMIEVLLRNRGERATMINAANIEFTYDHKHYFVDCVGLIPIEMNPGYFKSHYLNFYINEKDIEIKHDIKNVKLKIIHTHDDKEKTITEIKKLPMKTL